MSQLFDRLYRFRHEDKVTRAIRREMRRIKFALYLTLARLHLLKFGLKMRGLAIVGLLKIMEIF
jgi:hypothetical protein